MSEPVETPLEVSDVEVEVEPEQPAHEPSVNILDDPSVKDAYDMIYVQVEDIIADGGVDEENIAYILKAVMEAIDAVGQFAQWEGPTKAAKAKELARHVIDDLYAKGKMNEQLHKDLVTALSVLSGAMFALTVLADKGKILFQHVANGVQRACARCRNRRAERVFQDRADRERRRGLHGDARDRLAARAHPSKSRVRSRESSHQCNCEHCGVDAEPSTCCCKNDQCGRCLTV